MKALASVLVAMTFAFPAAAQDVLIRNATVRVPDSGDAPQTMDVRLRGSHIVEVGAALSPGPSTQIVDAAGRPLTPGFFGGLTALGLEEISLEPATVDNAHTPGAGEIPGDVGPRPEFDVTPAYNPESVAIGVNRIEGITFTLLAPIALPGGSIFAGIGNVARLNGRSDVFEPASRTLMIDLGSDSAILTGNSRAAQYMLLDQAAREAIPDRNMRDSDFRLLTPNGRDVMASFLDGGRIAFRVDRAADIRQALGFCTTHGCRPVIVGGAEAWRVAADLAAAEVPVILDPLDNLPESFDQLGAGLATAARLHEAGVMIAFTSGVDSTGTHAAYKVRQAAGNAVAHGLPWGAALAALTRDPAEIFGLGDSLGRIEPGYQADLVLWSGDPLEVTTHAMQVWIAGVPQSMQSRQSALRDRYRPSAQ